MSECRGCTAVFVQRVDLRLPLFKQFSQVQSRIH